MHTALAVIIAQVAHEANRAYSVAVCGDDSHAQWFAAPQWQRDSSIAGVQFLIDNPGAGPRETHESWLKQKVADGWKHGDVKDAIGKTHPCMVSYDELPVEQRGKDVVYLGVVSGLISFFDKEGAGLPCMVPVLAEEKRVADVEREAVEKQAANEKRVADDDRVRSEAAAASVASLAAAPLTDDDKTPVDGAPVVDEA